MSLEVGFEGSEAQARSKVSLFLLPMDLDVELLQHHVCLHPAMLPTIMD